MNDWAADRARAVLPSVLLSWLLALPLACSDSSHTTAEFFVFGTLVEVQLFDTDHDRAQGLFASLQEEFQRMHHQWHAWEPGELSRVNDAFRAGDSIETTPDIVELVRLSQHMEKRSGGRFNPAIGALISLWGFHTSEFPIFGPPPRDSDIESALKGNPSTLDIAINGRELHSANNSVQLDFGAIAKGYALDIAAEMILAADIEAAIVNAGGDMMTIGSLPGRPWKIAVRDPLGGLAGSIDIASGAAVFTSGNYQRFREHADERYPHIIDPRTGWPVQEIASVTVVADYGAVADAAATALMVTDSSEWLRIAENIGIEAFLVIDESGQIYASDTMSELFTPAEGRDYRLLD